MRRNRFVVDGHQRAIAGIQSEIARIEAETRRTVQAEYAGRLEDAGPLRRRYLQSKMSREIRRRVRLEIEKYAPPYGLYSKSPPYGLYSKSPPYGLYSKR